jgi:phosphoenolpyruvate carboxykinase (GTP)
VNWFRQGADGKFLWPGFGDNLRPIAWALERVAGRAEGNETAIGVLPRAADINTQGLDIAPGALDDLLSVKNDAWKQEVAAIRKYLGEYGARTPKALFEELDGVEQRLG